MAIFGKLFQRRFPAYLGGLLISLAAMLAMFQAKRALLPTFHPFTLAAAPLTVAPGGSIHFVYNEEPGHFLIPGLPSAAAVTGADGSPILRMDYGPLVDSREPALGPMPSAGTFTLRAELYICARPGVADCAKLSAAVPVEVRAGAPASVAVPIDLPGWAEKGLVAGTAAASPSPTPAR